MLPKYPESEMQSPGPRARRGSNLKLGGFYAEPELELPGSCRKKRGGRSYRNKYRLSGFGAGRT